MAQIRGAEEKKLETYFLYDESFFDESNNVAGTFGMEELEVV